VVFVSRAVLKLDRSEKIVESASGIALDASMVAPGVLACVAFRWKLLEKVFVAVVAIFASGLAGFAPLKKRSSEFLADDALLVSVVVECVEGGATFVVSNVGLGLVDVGSQGDLLDFEAAAGSPSGTNIRARVFVTKSLAGIDVCLIGAVFCGASVAFLLNSARILEMKFFDCFKAVFGKSIASDACVVDIRNLITTAELVT